MASIPFEKESGSIYSRGSVPATSSYVDEHQAALSFSRVVPVDIHVHDLEVAVRTQAERRLPWQSKTPSHDMETGTAGQKTIVTGISAHFPSGSLTAIIGGSGSGKTTTLNILSQRMGGSNLQMKGSILYNGSPDIANISDAYVAQSDLLLPTLTVRETLMYAADLRLPSTTTYIERIRLVEEIIIELGLKECADTIVGDGQRRKGCSGGERRRVSLGIQMLSNPSVLWLDEVTTGLDATSALQLVTTLKQLARRGRTIVTTIHQPRSDIFFLFDRVMILTRGRLTYSGLVSECLPWFNGLLPDGLGEHVNPADYLIDISSVDTRTAGAERESQARVSKLVSAWQAQSQTSDDNYDHHPLKQTASTPKLDNHAPFFRQIRVLTSRTLITTWRDPMGLMASWAEAILMGLVSGLVFLHLSKSSSGIRDREGALYIGASLQAYLILLFETYRLTGVDINLFDRERGEGVYGVVTWLLSRRLARGLLEDIVVPFIFTFVFYFLCRFDADAAQFFTFFVIVLVNHFIAVSFATFCAAASRDFTSATLIANTIFTLQSFSCGFFIQSSTIPVYVRWMKYLSNIYYAFGALCSNEFTDSFYDCPTGDARTDPTCISFQGNYILSTLGVDRNWFAVPLLALIGFVGFFTIASLLLLKFKAIQVNVSSARKSSMTPAEDRGERENAALEKARTVHSTQGRPATTVDVRLVRFALDVSKRSVTGGTKRVCVLKGVSTLFEAGKLNVIMGPSGSGKSSLLNMMALRNRSSLLTTYQSSGTMLLNGSIASNEGIRSLVSYVTQDDGGLLPYLTVREMLHTSAGLRLPKEMSKLDKIAKAEEIIVKFGLKDCADNLIGDEMIKGISGGEKRRVSIAIQVLTEPAILILDEPTSGLDAATSKMILEVLSDLASEGRTVICTIHQGRSDLFPFYGNVLLLAKGGYVAYSGSASDMLSHFASLDYACPPEMNPSDFALDLVSVDLREAGKEQASRQKVKALTDEYDTDSEVVRQEDEVALALAEMQAGRTTSYDLYKIRKEFAPFRVSYPILLRRGILNLTRRPDMMSARIGQIVAIGLIITLFFTPLGHDYFSVQNRLGLIQEILPLYFVGMLVNVALYPSERDVFYREHDDRAYSVEAFIISYMTVQLPMEIISACLFSALATFAVGLPRTLPMFLIVALNTLCIVSSGESIGIIFNTVFSSSTGFSLNVTSTVLSVGNFMAGIMSIDMPTFLHDINFLSPLKYAAANLVVFTFRGMTFTCPTSESQMGAGCPITTGEQVIEMFRYGAVDPYRFLGHTFVSTVIYRLIAYLVVKLARTHWERRSKRP